jgi:hypothetical protein
MHPYDIFKPACLRKRPELTPGIVSSVERPADHAH